MKTVRTTERPVRNRDGVEAQAGYPHSSIREENLLTSAALGAAQFALASLFGLALGFADDERATTDILGGIDFIVCQWVISWGL